MAVRYVSQMCPDEGYELQLLDTKTGHIAGKYKNIAVCEAVKDKLNKQEKEKWMAGLRSGH